MRTIENCNSLKPSSKYENIKKILDEINLSERDLFVLRSYYVEGLSYEKIGEIVKLTRERIRQVIVNVTNLCKKKVEQQKQLDKVLEKRDLEIKEKLKANPTKNISELINNLENKISLDYLTSSLSVRANNCLDYVRKNRYERGPSFDFLEDVACLHLEEILRIRNLGTCVAYEIIKLFNKYCGKHGDTWFLEVFELAKKRGVRLNRSNLNSFIKDNDLHSKFVYR